GERRGRFARLPEPLERLADALGRGLILDVEVDHHVRGVVGRAVDAVGDDARARTVDRIAVERRLPEVEVGDRVLQANGGHAASSLIGYIRSVTNSGPRVTACRDFDAEAVGVFEERRVVFGVVL